METMQAILSRKSVRSYTGKKISKDALNTILKAAKAAPERVQDDTPRAERAPKPARPEAGPAPRPEAKPPESAKKEGEEFSLEDILAEFGGK